MIIYTQGSFDILHSGHMNILRKCRKLAGKDGKVVVALLTDQSYERYRKQKPAKEYRDRKALLESLIYVDEVIPCDHKKSKNQIRKIKPDWVVLGSDWATKDIYTQYRMKKEELNKILLFFPYTTEISSTKIKERIRNGFSTMVD